MGLNYDLGNKLENFRRMYHFEKFNNATRNFFLAENARFFEHYVRIFPLWQEFFKDCFRFLRKINEFLDKSIK